MRYKKYKNNIERLEYLIDLLEKDELIEIITKDIIFEKLTNIKEEFLVEFESKILELQKIIIEGEK